MLEEKQSYAEQIVKKQRSFREGENINYIDPDNDIEKGYIIINYRKRELERMALQDGATMVLPGDWQYAGMENGETFFYACPYEKEVLVLQKMEGSHMDMKEMLEEMEKEIQERDSAKPGEKDVGTGKDGIRIPYFDWTENDRYYFSFFRQEKGKILNGIFRVHVYRKKAWQRIFPQFLRTFCMEGMEGQCHE